MVIPQKIAAAKNGRSPFRQTCSNSCYPEIGVTAATLPSHSCVSNRVYGAPQEGGKSRLAPVEGFKRQAANGGKRKDFPPGGRAARRSADSILGPAWARFARQEKRVQAAIHALAPGKT